MSLKDDKHLDVCQNIEVGLKLQYEENSNLTDLKAMLGTGRILLHKTMPPPLAVVLDHRMIIALELHHYLQQQKDD